MRTYAKNIPVTFHRDPIWNDGALGFFEDGHCNKKNKMISDVISIPELKNR